MKTMKRDVDTHKSLHRGFWSSYIFSCCHLTVTASLSINTKQTHPQSYKLTKKVFLESEVRKTPCITAMLTSHHTGNVYPKEKYQRCSIKLCEQRWESKAFQHKVVFVFKFHTFICRDCQSSAVQRRCNSVITPRATGTTEDLRVRAVMGRVCVSLCVHVRMCVCVCAHVQLPLLRSSVTVWYR